MSAIAEIRPPKDTNRTAIVFVHGFTGTGQGTWRDLGPRILQDPRLSAWDGWTIAYGTSWLPDVSGIWSADATLEILADGLATDIAQATLQRYDALVLIAHSMGGLIVQRALLDHPSIVSRIHAVILFGTPSGGLVKARLLWFWKRQLAGMAQDGEFIKRLRDDWTRRFTETIPFEFLAVAGEKDQFVPPKSSLAPFGREQCAVISGNHVTMIHPPAGDPTVADLVVQRIVRAGPAGNVGDSSRVAIELGDFRRAVRELEPHAGELDARALVRLAIALDGLGQRDKAYKLLADRGNLNSDVIGTLAGRLKREWLFSGRRQRDAEAAETHYAKGYELAKVNKDLRQSYYHGINLAFLAFAFRDDRGRARQYAREVLGICDRCQETDEWLDATMGEAHLILANAVEALAAYGRFVEAGNDPWKVSSTYLNARTIVGMLGKRELACQLGEIFGDPKP